MNNKIKEYWEERANQHPDKPDATTNDIYLRELEISTIIKTMKQLSIPAGGLALDIGCGDGHSTIKVAKAFDSLHFLGMDYSENMIKNANKSLKSNTALKPRLKFIVGDINNLEQMAAEKTYDIIITDRCLINLDSSEGQYKAITNIAKLLKPTGCYIAIENFLETHENMNRARSDMGLPMIPVRWHNLYFQEQEFIANLKPVFEDIKIVDFSSSYYFATRVIYSKMCQMRGETPNYEHEIHKLAAQLPWTGKFSPVRMAVLKTKQG